MAFKLGVFLAAILIVAAAATAASDPPGPTLPAPRSCPACPACPCTCRRERFAPGEGAGEPVAPPTPSDSSPPLHQDCSTVLRGVSSCVAYLTGTEQQPPTPDDSCCRALAEFFRNSAAGDDHNLRCACPLVTGEINRFITRPVNSLRLLYLPVACSVPVPNKIFGLCLEGSTGKAVSP